METDAGNVELHAASLAQGIAALLAEQEAPPSASPRNGGDAPQDAGLCAIDETIDTVATTAVEDDGASSATARDSDGRAKVTLSVSLPLEPAETSGLTADGIEEGQPPSSPSPPSSFGRAFAVCSTDVQLGADEALRVLVRHRRFLRCSKMFSRFLTIS